MKRDYKNTQSDNTNFFVGQEVEKTPAFGLTTLFVVGIQPVSLIQDYIDDSLTYENKENHIKHIFFGANHSYNPTIVDEWEKWDHMIQHFLDLNYLCSLDIPINKVDEFHDGGLCESNNFIPQIRVPIPYIRLWNYNTMIKIDDKGFNETNPGVWCHSLHSLLDRSKFTDWNQYRNDEVLS